MNFRFDFTQEEQWPPLAWIAECDDSDPVIRVRHGQQVETKTSWFCEAIWDGEFETGDLDRTDLVFGSGARLRDGRALFVSSGSTVDRLQFLKIGDKVLISNSLACLLGVSGTKLDPTFGGYRDLFASIVQGIDTYVRRLPTESGRLELVYFRNLVWDGERLAEEDKPTPLRDFPSFTNYHSYKSFLDSAVQRIAKNMAATAREHRYEMLGTLSSGYDSVTSATLCRSMGMKKAFSFRTARDYEEDHGTEIAKMLGLELMLFDRRDWRDQDFPEVPFFASDGRGPDVIFSGAESALKGRVLVTGFHGDKVWGKDTKALGPDIVRGDPSGLSFCEYRLSVGCIHFPVAFMGVRMIAEINALSNAQELVPWDVTGEYSRPICRRIIEEAGVPRDLFGVKKKATTSLFHRGESILTNKTRAEYHSWLRDIRKTRGGGSGIKHKIPNRLLLAVRDYYYLLFNLARWVTRPLSAKVQKEIERRLVNIQRALYRRTDLIQYIFPWAIERMARMYRGGGES